MNKASTALPFESSIKFSSNNVSKQQQRKSESEINKVINFSSNSTTGNSLTTSTSNHAYNNVATENKIAKPQFFNNGNGSHQNFSNSAQNAKTTFTFSPILPIKSKSKVFFFNPSPIANYYRRCISRRDNKLSFTDLTIQIFKKFNFVIFIGLSLKNSSHHLTLR